MTCIVGVKDGDRLFMGGDSAASTPQATEIYTFAAPKVFAVGEYLIGITMSFRAGQLLRHQLDWPAPPDGAEIERFLVREIVPKVRRAWREGGALKESEGVESGAQLMIGLRGQLVSIATDLSVCTLAEPFLAIGSGHLPAYGALHAMADLPLPAEDKVRRALEAAAHFTTNVRPPFVLLSSAAAPG